MFEALYKHYIESNDLFTVTVLISVAVHMLTVLSFSFIPFLFQFIPYFQKYKIQPSKSYPLLTQIGVAGSVLFAQVVYQGPFIIFNYYWFKHFQIPYDYASIPTLFPILWKMVICLVIEDAWHYWAHRALHHPALYKRFHKQHHSFEAPFAIQAEYAHPFETIFTGIGFFIGFALFCDHLMLMWIWMAVRVAETTDVHSGYDIPISPFYLLPGYAGARVHDFHHYNFEGNYAPTFVWWDKICGTDNFYREYNEKKSREKLEKINQTLSYQKPELEKLREGKTLEYGPLITGKYSYVVTGGKGMVGKRVLKMLVDSGAKRVTSLDIVETPESEKLPKVNYIICDIENLAELTEHTKNHDIMIHTAALVGPFHPKEKYLKVNYKGTLNVIEACKANSIRALVDCSSPSTRMDGSDILGAESSQLQYAENRYVHEYARTKALGEIAVLRANCESLRTCAVAPHQVYGEEDLLFLPNIVKAAHRGLLRVFGDGENIVSFTYVDNIAYALHLAGNVLMSNNYRDVAGKFYVVTDGDAQYFWKVINDGCKKQGLAPIFDKMFIGRYWALILGYLAEFFSKITGSNSKLTSFSVKMIMNNRYFSIKEAQTDFGYEPIYKFEENWTRCIAAVLKRIV